MDQKSSTYRWVCLAMAFLVSLSCSVCQFVPSVFARELMEALSLSSSQYATILTCPMLIGLAISYVAGSLGDRIGVKRTVLAGLAVSTVTALLRSFAPTYPTLFLASLLMGTVSVALSANVLKIASGWFPAGEVGLAVGVVTATGTAGGAVAQALFGLLFSTFRGACLGCVGLLLVISLLWMALFRDADLPEASPNASAGANEKAASTKSVFRERRLWVMAAGTAVAMGCQMAVQGFLTVTLPEKGVAEAALGFTASLFTWGALVGGIVVPPMLALTRAAKAAGIGLCVGGGTLLMAAWLAPTSAFSNVLLVCSGFLVGAIMPAILTFPALLPEFGPERAGAVGGAMATCNMVAAFVLPSYVVAPLAARNNTATFAICAALLAIPALSFALLPSLSKLTKAQEKTRRLG